ncbi:MAG: class I SAM-dependent methyltransferase, partial [Candidatus Omnitrophica bacterium]|nr:class I SAM-dependent methyltransferase [Candidatus Omnitrophota bacterium]
MFFPVLLTFAGLCYYFFEPNYYGPFASDSPLRSPKSYGPYWVVFNQDKFNRLARYGLPEFLESFLAKVVQIPYLWFGIPAQDHAAYVVPDEELSFFTTNLDKAKDQGLISADEAEDLKQKIISYSQVPAHEKLNPVRAPPEMPMRRSEMRMPKWGLAAVSVGAAMMVALTLPVAAESIAVLAGPEILNQLLNAGIIGFLTACAAYLGYLLSGFDLMVSPKVKKEIDAYLDRYLNPLRRGFPQYPRESTDDFLSRLDEASQGRIPGGINPYIGFVDRTYWVFTEAQEESGDGWASREVMARVTLSFYWARAFFAAVREHLELYAPQDLRSGWRDILEILREKMESGELGAQIREDLASEVSVRPDSILHRDLGVSPQDPDILRLQGDYIDRMLSDNAEYLGEWLRQDQDRVTGLDYLESISNDYQFYDRFILFARPIWLSRNRREIVTFHSALRSHIESARQRLREVGYYRSETRGTNIAKLQETMKKFRALQAAKKIVLPEYHMAYGTLWQSFPEMLQDMVAKFNLGPADKILDVGSGDGLAAHMLAEMTGADITGVEFAPLRHQFAVGFQEYLREQMKTDEFWTRQEGVDYSRIQLVGGDFLDQPLAGYTFIYFSFTGPYERLVEFSLAILEKLERELPPGVPFVCPLFGGGRRETMEVVFAKYFEAHPDSKLEYEVTGIATSPTAKLDTAVIQVKGTVPQAQPARSETRRPAEIAGRPSGTFHVERAEVRSGERRGDANGLDQQIIDALMSEQFETARAHAEELQAAVKGVRKPNARISNWVESTLELARNLSELETALPQGAELADSAEAMLLEQAKEPLPEEVLSTSVTGFPVFENLAAVLNDASGKRTALIPFHDVDQKMMTMIAYAKTIPGVQVAVIPPLQDYWYSPCYIVTRNPEAVSEITKIFNWCRRSGQLLSLEDEERIGRYLGYPADAVLRFVWTMKPARQKISMAEVEAFWSLEGLSDLKRLVLKYRNVFGMGDYVRRLIAQYAEAGATGAMFREVAGELIVADYLVRRIKGAQLIALGVYVGHNEIDFMLKVDPEHAVEGQDLDLDPGLYLVEAKEKKMDEIRGELETAVRVQIPAQAKQAGFLKQMGYPVQRLMAAGAGRPGTEEVAVGRLETNSAGGVTAWMMVTAPFDVTAGGESVELPGAEQVERWNRERSSRTAGVIRNLNQYFPGIYNRLRLAEQQASQAAYRELCARERLRITIMQKQKKRDLQWRFDQLERKKDIDGWADRFREMGVVVPSDPKQDPGLTPYFLQYRQSEISRTELNSHIREQIALHTKPDGHPDRETFQKVWEWLIGEVNRLKEAALLRSIDIQREIDAKRQAASGQSSSSVRPPAQRTARKIVPAVPRPPKGETVPRSVRVPRELVIAFHEAVERGDLNLVDAEGQPVDESTVESVVRHYFGQGPEAEKQFGPKRSQWQGMVNASSIGYQKTWEQLLADYTAYVHDHPEPTVETAASLTAGTETATKPPAADRSEMRKETGFEDLTDALARAGFTALDQMKNAERLIASTLESSIHVREGGNSKVYDLSGVEGYVLKAPDTTWSGPNTIGPLERVPDPFPDLNVGQPVAQMGKYLILKKQLGMPAGVPYGPVRRSAKSGDAVAQTESDRIYEQHLERTADMPQSAYVRFAQLLERVNAGGYKTDPSKADNVWVDRESESFNLIDLGRKQPNTVDDNLISMVIPLFDNPYTYKGSRLNDVMAWRQTILDKCIQAARVAGLPMPALERSASLEFSFALAGRESDWPKFSATLPHLAQRKGASADAVVRSETRMEISGIENLQFTENRQPFTEDLRRIILERLHDPGFVIRALRVSNPSMTDAFLRNQPVIEVTCPAGAEPLGGSQRDFIVFRAAVAGTEHEFGLLAGFLPAEQRESMSLLARRNAGPRTGEFVSAGRPIPELGIMSVEVIQGMTLRELMHEGRERWPLVFEGLIRVIVIFHQLGRAVSDVRHNLGNVMITFNDAGDAIEYVSIIDPGMQEGIHATDQALYEAYEMMGYNLD